MTPNTNPVRVSDHCVIRYLERAMNLNVEIVREHIFGICAGAAAIGANSVLAEGLRFEISMNTVTTVRPGGTSLSKTSKAKSQDRIRLDKRHQQ